MKGKNDFIRALLKEMALRRDYIGDEKVETVYFGGGTPSILETDDLLRVTDELRAGFDILPDAEITLEANPDDIVTAGRPFFMRTGVSMTSSAPMARAFSVT